MAINYEDLVKDIIMPLVIHQDDVIVKNLGEVDGYININISVNEADIGRVIGKNGKIASAVRTICYACASRENKRLNLEFEAY